MPKVKPDISIPSEAPVLNMETVYVQDEYDYGDKLFDANGDELGELSRLPKLENQIYQIPLEYIVPRYDQPRKDKTLRKEEEEGTDQLKPITVVPFLDNNQEVKFLICDGERRYLKAIARGEENVMCSVVWDPDLDSLFEKAVVANVARESMNPMDEVEAYVRIMRAKVKKGLAPDMVRAREDLAKDIEKEPLYIQTREKLLKLHEEIQEFVRKRILNLSQAASLTKKHLLTKNIQLALAEKLNELYERVQRPFNPREVDLIVREVSANVRTAASKSANSVGASSSNTGNTKRATAAVPPRAPDSIDGRARDLVGQAERFATQAKKLHRYAERFTNKGDGLLEILESAEDISNDGTRFDLVDSVNEAKEVAEALLVILEDKD